MVQLTYYLGCEEARGVAWVGELKLWNAKFSEKRRENLRLLAGMQLPYTLTECMGNQNDLLDHALSSVLRRRLEL